MHWQRAERAANVPGLVDKLASLSNADLTSVFMEIARRRAAGRTPASLVRAWETDTFVGAATIDQRELRRAEVAMLDAAADFEAVELSGVVPLGTCTVVAEGGQNRILSAARNLEVLADPTNAMALECAVRRAAEPETTVRLCTSVRLIRAQRVEAPFTQHFHMFASVIAGRDPGGRRFEREAVRTQMALVRSLCGVFEIGPVTFTVRASSELEALAAEFTEDVEPLEGDYYAGLRFQAWLGDMNIADGGLVDWVAQLRSDKKEKLVTMGFGTELAVRMAQGSFGSKNVR